MVESVIKMLYKIFLEVTLCFNLHHIILYSLFAPYFIKHMPNIKFVIFYKK